MSSQEIVSRKIPTLQELYADAESFNQSQALNAILNSNPKPEWIKHHPIIRTANGNPYTYLPIQRIEWLLTRIFGEWRVEVMHYGLIANALTVQVRLHYLLPNGIWTYQDGVGASPIQTDKGAGAVDFNAIKSSAVQMALPAAKTYAVKDAAEQIGKLFGKDMSRMDEIAYGYMGISPENPPTSNKSNDDIIAEIETTMSKIMTLETLNTYAASKKSELIEKDLINDDLKLKINELYVATKKRILTPTKK